MAEEKSKGGRPTTYDPKYCSQIINVLKRPAVVETFCAEIGVAKSTFYLWVKKHKEFSDAFNKARTAQISAMVEIGLKGMWGAKDGFSPQTYQLFMQNIAGWTTKREHSIDSATKEVIKLAYSANDLKADE